LSKDIFFAGAKSATQFGLPGGLLYQAKSGKQI
jgi:hypothetical protein